MTDTWAPVEGKYGKTRDGQNTGPIEKSGGVIFPWKATSHDGRFATYTPDGKQFMEEDSENDLISEWVEEPVASRQVKVGDWVKILKNAVGKAAYHKGARARVIRTSQESILVDIENGAGSDVLLDPKEWEFADAPADDVSSNIVTPPAQPAFDIAVWDQYAIEAMRGWLRYAIQPNPMNRVDYVNCNEENLSATIARLADAMMAERAKREKGA